MIPVDTEVEWRTLNVMRRGRIKRIGWMPDGRTDLYFIQLPDGRMSEALEGSLRIIENRTNDNK